MNVIFLDCDGVLNNSETDVIAKGTGFIGIDEENLKHLLALIRQSHAKIVLTSTWQDEPAMLRYLKKKLLRHFVFIKDVTNENSIYRGSGISRYVAKHHVAHYVVLDDFCFPDFESEGIMPHLVLTDFHRGLTAEDVQQALTILASDVREKQ